MPVGQQRDQRLSGEGRTVRSAGGALWESLRPRQWIKNLVVLAAPLAAGRLFEVAVAWRAIVAVVAFCLASSAGYLVNDVCDVTADRQHPVKSARPVAAGRLGMRTAVGAAVVLAAAGLGVSVLTGQPRLVAVVAVYLGLTLSYSLGAKQIAVIELAIVSAGFLLRAIAGGVATDIRLSSWFLLVASFGSLFMVAGKRYSEMTTRARSDASDDAAAAVAATDRSALPTSSAIGYSASYLRFVWSVSAGATLFAYAMWAFDSDLPHTEPSWAQISVAPFVLALLRYAVDIDRGKAEQPEEIVLNDHVLQVLGLAWLITFSVAAGVF
jgi:decaprenyl-phosphate phosphoribosyltransferase